MAKGFNQIVGRNFYETFSPLIRTNTIKLVLSLTLQNRWNIRQLDIKNIFLRILKKSVFLEQPWGYKDKVNPDHVWRLKKVLYGLKQTPRTWFIDTLSKFLLNLNFICS